jgi:hypothetical protein
MADSGIGAALRDRLTKDEKPTGQAQQIRSTPTLPLWLFPSLALIAFWFPLGIAIVTTMPGHWLALGLRAGYELFGV